MLTTVTNNDVFQADAEAAPATTEEVAAAAPAAEEPAADGKRLGNKNINIVFNTHYSSYSPFSSLVCCTNSNSEVKGWI